nr:FAD:protein FMN transferase [Sporolactobacillus mangiferae]
MDTLITIKVVSDKPPEQIDAIINQSVENFYYVEHVCSRFESDSELMRLCRHTREPVPVSPLLYHAVSFALEVAKESDGAFDPTIGRAMELRGFNRNYLHGQSISSSFADSADVDYHDIELIGDRYIYLKRALVIDLNAVVKGMAVDLTANAMKQAGLANFLINAGGDIYVSGNNDQKEPWRIGIRDPFHREQCVGIVCMRQGAICTSGNYERRMHPNSEESHLFKPNTHQSPRGLSSCTVVAPFAMLADAFSTTAYVLGLERGMNKMEELGFDCLMITHTANQFFTQKFKENLLWNVLIDRSFEKKVFRQNALLNIEKC